MRVMAQMSMVMNLDKCIGCHTCSVTCKQAWTNRSGTEYVWWNNVETRPGLGYPRTYEDQERWKGGWELGKNGRLKLKAGGRAKKLMHGKKSRIGLDLSSPLFKGLPEENPDKIASVCVLKLEFDAPPRQVLGPGYVIPA